MDIEGTSLDTGLMALLWTLMEELHCYHPYTDPGLWDLTVDRIRAVRVTIEAQQAMNIKAANKPLNPTAKGAAA